MTQQEPPSALLPLFNQMTLAQRIKYNLSCFESDPPHNQFAKGMKQMLDDLAPYAEPDREVELLEVLEEIQQFCDDPSGSEKPESLAMGLSRMLPKARAAIARARSGGQG